MVTNQNTNLLYITTARLVLCVQRFKSDFKVLKTWKGLHGYSGVSRLVKLPRHFVGPVTQEFETPILLDPSQPNEKNLITFITATVHSKNKWVMLTHSVDCLSCMHTCTTCPG